MQEEKNTPEKKTNDSMRSRKTSAPSFCHNARRDSNAAWTCRHLENITGRAQASAARSTFDELRTHQEPSLIFQLLVLYFRGFLRKGQVSSALRGRLWLLQSSDLHWSACEQPGKKAGWASVGHSLGK